MSNIQTIPTALNTANTFPWGDLTDPSKPQSVKVRLVNVYKNAGEGQNMAMMKEINALSFLDLVDFARWFDESGYPTLPPVAQTEAKAS